MSQRDQGYYPNQERCFLLSGRASFLNLRTITTEIVLEEEFKQNKMGTMAGTHSEILSNEPERWLEAAEPGQLRDTSDPPGLAACPCPPRRQRPRHYCSHRAQLHPCFPGKVAPSSSSQQRFAPGLAKLSARLPTQL